VFELNTYLASACIRCNLILNPKLSKLIGWLYIISLQIINEVEDCS